jgi:hypothetical protein
MSAKQLLKGWNSLVIVAMRFPDGKNSNFPLPVVPRSGETVIADGKRYTVASVEWSCHEFEKYDATLPHVRLNLANERDSFIRE